MTLLPPSFPAAQDYTVTVQTTSLLGNLAYENTRVTKFRKQPLEKTRQGWLFAVTILDFQQSEPKGLAELDADTLGLRRELLIETDGTGALARVCNKDALRRHWAALEPELLRKYRDSDLVSPGMVSGVGMVLHGDGYLEDVLRRGYEYGTLFPGLYGQAYGAAPVAGRPRTIARFLGNLDLPLLTTATLREEVPADVQYGIVVEGQVDQANYPADAARQALRTMTDRYDLDTTLRAQHLESYEFDHAGELQHAAQFTVYGVEGVFFHKTVCTLGPVAS